MAQALRNPSRQRLPNADNLSGNKLGAIDLSGISELQAAIKKGLTPPFCIAARSLDNVYEYKEPYPNYVDKVPIPARCFKSKAILGRKVSFHGAKQLNQQHECAQSNVKTVEARQNKERRSVDSAAKRQPKILIGVNILGYLKYQEY